MVHSLRQHILNIDVTLPIDTIKHKDKKANENR